MKKTMKTTFYLLFMVMLLLPSTATALVVSPIDLNDFSTDGAVLTFPKSPHKAYLAFMFGESALVNDPFYGHEGIAVDTNAMFLNFDYLFLTPPDSGMSFSALLYDIEDPFPIKEYYTDHSSSGHVSWDLRDMFSGPTSVGLHFYIDREGGEEDAAALAVISKPVLVSADNVPVPEPATLILLGAGLLGMAGLGRKKMFE